MNLFQKGDITLSSGIKSDFKIDCDTLTDQDIECLAYLISNRVSFRLVFGVPTGGLRLSAALEKYRIDNEDLPILLVDDVLTTGESMEREKREFGEDDIKNMKGYVIFAREKCPDWIDTLFKMY